MPVVGGGAKSNVATYFVILKHWNERKAASAKLDAVLGKFMGGASQIKEAVIFGFAAVAAAYWLTGQIERTMRLLGVRTLDELEPGHVTQLVRLEPRSR